MGMKQSILLLSVLTASSCSDISDFVENKKGGRKFSTSNPIFDEYIARFEELGRFYTKDPYFKVGDIPINFGDTENDLYDGVCFTYTNGTKEIIIKKSWWDNYEKDADPEGDKKKVENVKKELEKNYSLIQESLIFHELGHCRLNRKHEETTLVSSENTVKKSMMSHNIITANDYLKYKDGYWEELFTNSTDTLENLLKQK